MHDDNDLPHHRLPTIDCHLPLQEAEYFLNTQEFFGYRIAESQGFLVFFFKVKIKVIQLVFGLASLGTFGFIAECGSLIAMCLGFKPPLIGPN